MLRAAAARAQGTLLAAVLLLGGGARVSAADQGEKASGRPAEKTIDKAAEKTAEKTAEKPAEKASEKPAEKPVEKASVKPAEKVGEKPAERTGEKPAASAPTPTPSANDRLAEKLAKDAASATKVKKQVKKATGQAETVDEPEVQPPPLKVSALKNEIRRRADGGGGEHNPKGERESLVKLATELNAAREALRQDTARMETLMAGAPAAAQDQEAGGKKPPAPLDIVAKAMRGMKPEQAGPIVTHMERKLAADVLRRMPPADAGKVMASLKPELAAELAAEIALRSPHAERKR